MINSISMQNNFAQGMQNGMQRPGGIMRDPLQPAMLEKLSERTGLSTEDLEASFKDGSHFQILQNAGISRSEMDEIRLEVVNEAMASGELTQDQADRMSQMRPPGPPRGGDMVSPMKQVLSQITEALNLDSEEELWEMIPENTSLWDYAEENGVDMQKFNFTSMIDTFI
jgi:hypothetical protein